MAKLLRSYQFRLSLVYLAVFGGSVVLLLAFLYWATVGYMSRQTDATIEAEIQGLAEQSRRRGLAGLSTLLAERARYNQTSVYLLTDAKRKPLLGNLGRWPQGALEVDDWLDLLLTQCVQPQLGQSEPVILYDYPVSQAALAQVRDQQPPVAERFELYVRGIELANGYHELLDPALLRQRAATANQGRQAAGKYALPEDNRLLAAMQHGLPPCCGVALGFDRLAMVASGAASLAQVMAFPIERA